MLVDPKINKDRLVSILNLLNNEDTGFSYPFFTPEGKKERQQFYDHFYSPEGKKVSDGVWEFYDTNKPICFPDLKCVSNVVGRDEIFDWCRCDTKEKNPLMFYGMADSIEQILEKAHWYINDPRKFVLLVSKLHHEPDCPNQGFRFHKNGSYHGNYNMECEHFNNEVLPSDFKGYIYTYHFYAI